MKKFLFSFLLLLLTGSVFALQSIRGKIVDESTNRPLDFVNVALLTAGNPAPTTGVVSDEDGNFYLPNVPNGKYTLRISFVGYNPIELPLNLSDKELNMGLIKLREDSKTLNEVQVVGQGSQMRFEIDKKIFTVDQNISAAGGSATEVLQNIPSIDVDNEGNVSLRNSTSVEVWINGKPSGLTADNRAQILQQMPAESIESIEIMTNPSARYNPEGTSGIINLVLKKNRKAGYYGSVSAGSMWSVGTTPGFNSGFNINYSKGRFDTYFNIGYRAMNFVGGGWNNRYSLNGTDTLTLLEQNTTMLRQFSGLFTRAGVDYRINDNHTIGISGFGMLRSGGGGSTINYLLTDYSDMSVMRNYSRVNDENSGRPGMNVSLDYRWDVNDKGSNLMSSLSYSTHQGYSEENYLQKDFLSNDSSYMRQRNEGQNKEYQFKLDYTHMFSESNRLEAGWQSTIQDRFGPNSAINLINNQPLYAYYNEFDYNEQIHAAYATYGTRFNNLSIQGGLRGEYFWRHPINTVLDDNGVEVETDYQAEGEMQWFPSVFLSYSLPENNEFQLNMTRRVDRPRGRQINPFRDFSDSLNISYGNLALKPEYTTALELNYLKTWDNHTLSTTVYHRFTDDVIQRVSYLNGPSMESTFMNITQSQSTGAEFVVKNNLFRILNLTSSVNLYYNKMDAATYTNPYDALQVTTIPGQENFTWSARMMGNIILGKSTTAQITGYYSAPRLIAQGKETASYAVDLGVRQTFFNRALSVNLMVRDLLDTRRRSSVTWGEGFYQQSESYFHGRMIGLTATYNFGNMRPKKTQTRQQEGEGEMGFDME